MHLLRVLRSVFAALPLWIATATSAGTIVPNPVDAIGAGSVVNARFLLIGTTTGLPAGGIVLGGDVAPSDTVLLLSVEYTGAPNLAATQIAIDRLGGGAFTNIGWIPGADVDWTAAVQPLPNLAFLQSGALVNGAVTDVFFLSAAGFTPGETFRFVFSPPGGGPGGIGEAQWVPEPGTLALLAGGLVLLSRAARRH